MICAFSVGRAKFDGDEPSPARGGHAKERAVSRERKMFSGGANLPLCVWLLRVAREADKHGGQDRQQG
ncbi:hypothetical protein GCM10027417_00610 [Glutamicibacter endophyticus]